MGVKERMVRLRRKEVVGISDGARYGFVGDAELELEGGQVSALIVPGRPRLFGLLGREEDIYIPWDSVRRFGEDIILVEYVSRSVKRKEPGKRVRKHMEK